MDTTKKKGLEGGLHQGIYTNMKKNSLRGLTLGEVYKKENKKQLGLAPGDIYKQEREKLEGGAYIGEHIQTRKIKAGVGLHPGTFTN